MNATEAHTNNQITPPNVSRAFNTVAVTGVASYTLVNGSVMNCKRESVCMCPASVYICTYVREWTS
jgi:hypothetical protein